MRTSRPQFSTPALRTHLRPPPKPTHRQAGLDLSDQLAAPDAPPAEHLAHSAASPEAGDFAEPVEESAGPGGGPGAGPGAGSRGALAEDAVDAHAPGALDAPEGVDQDDLEALAAGLS